MAGSWPPGVWTGSSDSGTWPPAGNSPISTTGPGDTRGASYPWRARPTVGPLISSGWDGTVKVWDVADPARPSLRHTLTGHAGLIRGLTFSPDGKTIASGSFDKTIKLWDPA